jgi:hypothetical protein
LTNVDTGSGDKLQAEGRAQILNASLNGIRRVVKPPS